MLWVHSLVHICLSQLAINIPLNPSSCRLSYFSYSFLSENIRWLVFVIDDILQGKLGTYLACIRALTLLLFWLTNHKKSPYIITFSQPLSLCHEITKHTSFIQYEICMCVYKILLIFIRGTGRGNSNPTCNQYNKNLLPLFWNIYQDRYRSMIGLLGNCRRIHTYTFPRSFSSFLSIVLPVTTTIRKININPNIWTLFKPIILKTNEPQPTISSS